MKRKATIGLAIFFSLLLVGVMGVNVTVASSTAPAWRPINDDIANWDLRWEGNLSETFLGGFDFEAFYNETGTSDAWGQVWSKNVSGAVNACALVMMIDLGKEYWDTPITNTATLLLIQLVFAQLVAVQELPDDLTVWKLFFWLINTSINKQATNFTASDVSTQPGFDHGIMVNGTVDDVLLEDRYIEFVMGTAGTGLTMSALIELNSTNIERIVEFGIANLSTDILEWIAATYAFVAFTILLGIISYWMVWYSVIIGKLNDLGLLSTATAEGLTLTTATDNNQTTLLEISNDATAAAAAKGFGGVSTTGTPPIPGFEALFILIPLMALIAFYGIARKRRNEIIS